MSRKPALQKRQIASRDSRRSLKEGAPKFRQFGKSGKVQGRLRQASGSGKGLRATAPILVSLVVVLLLSGGGWLGWQVFQTRSDLNRERLKQTEMTRNYRELSARRDKLLLREQIISRAANLGLYPPRPEQIRKLGTR